MWIAPVGHAGIAGVPDTSGAFGGQRANRDLDKVRDSMPDSMPVPEQFACPGSRFGSRFAVRGSRFGSRFAVRGSSAVLLFDACPGLRCYRPADGNATDDSAFGLSQGSLARRDSAPSQAWESLRPKPEC